VLSEIAEDRTALFEAGPAETHKQELAELLAKDGHGRREVGELTGRGSDRGVAADVPTGRPWRRLEVHRTVDE
jgi:hypothetical protein